MEVTMTRAKNGQAIRPQRRTGHELRKLRALMREAEEKNDLSTWKRAKAVLSYVNGEKVVAIKEKLGVNRSTVNKWLRWYDVEGADGLRTKKPPGPAPRLDSAQTEELTALIENGPQAAGFASGVWTGPMIGDLIRQQFGVSYHNQYVPELLHKLGFSVQRPRKRLARADAEAQETWIRERFPAIKKRPQPAVG
jgi:transposase